MLRDRFLNSCLKLQQDNLVQDHIIPYNIRQTLSQMNCQGNHFKFLTFDSSEDIYANIKTFHSSPPPPIYNMRHIHPVRQSGPIPAYDGTWNIEDIKKLYGNMRAPWDYTA